MAGFTCTVWSQQTENLALVYADAELVNCSNLPKILGQVEGFDNWHGNEKKARHLKTYVTN
jgi:hypothetical protein